MNLKFIIMINVSLSSWECLNNDVLNQEDFLSMLYRQVFIRSIQLLRMDIFSQDL